MSYSTGKIAKAKRLFNGTVGKYSSDSGGLEVFLMYICRVTEFLLYQS